jgi:hypothetical protein
LSKEEGGRRREVKRKRLVWKLSGSKENEILCKKISSCISNEKVEKTLTFKMVVLSCAVTTKGL